MLTQLPLLENSDDFVFDNQMLAQCVHFGFRIGEVSCPTKYFEEASSINFRRSVKYGLGVLGTTLQFALQRWGWRISGFSVLKADGWSRAMPSTMREAGREPQGSLGESAISETDPEPPPVRRLYPTPAKPCPPFGPSIASPAAPPSI